MRMLLAALALSLVATGRASAQNGPAEEDNKQVVMDFYVNGIHARNDEAAVRHLALGMIERNPRVPAGGQRA